ncbi:LytTR family DNA-binding domain-containing protein [Spirosoma knui]
MNAILIEDEKLVAREFAHKLGQVDADIRLIETLSSVRTALHWFNQHAEPDLVFADIQLADGVSFDIFAQYKLQCPIIFITSYNEYAIQAFKVNGIDYLLKPVDMADLSRAIAKARSLIRSQVAPPVDLRQLITLLQEPTAGAKAVYKETFLGQERNGWIPIATEDIAFFQYDGINFLVTKSGARYPVDYETLDRLEELLDPVRFYRANRQFIINHDAIQQVRNGLNFKLMLRLRSPHQSVEIDVSRQKAPAFKRWLDR